MNYHYRRNNFDTLSVLYRLRDGVGPWGSSWALGVPHPESVENRDGVEIIPEVMIVH